MGNKRDLKSFWLITTLKRNKAAIQSISSVLLNQHSQKWSKCFSKSSFNLRILLLISVANNSPQIGIPNVEKAQILHKNIKKKVPKLANGEVIPEK
jgi:hypothetical protein